MLRLTRKKALAVAALTLTALVAVFLLLPPAYEPPPRETRDEAEFALDEKVGWYLLDDSIYRMITWGAENGLTLNRFDDPARSSLRPVTRDLFTWQRSAGDYQLEFSRDQAGEIEGFLWRDELGRSHTARRLASAPYNQSDVRYSNDAVELAALLLTPPQPGPHPGIVFIHGSGVSDRDNYWYLYQADYLARRGIAVLLPDKRGTGKSGGAWHTASFEDFAGDALAGLELLQASANIDPARVGLLGLSQGGWVAPLAASRSKNVRFVINVSGSATTPNRQIRHELGADIRSSGAPHFIADLLAPLFAARAKARRRTFWRKNGDFDPIPYWRALTIPALIVYGEKDEDDNVPIAESVAQLRLARGDPPDTNFKIQLYQDSGHAMGDPATGWIRGDYLELLADWIVRAAYGSGREP